MLIVFVLLWGNHLNYVYDKLLIEYLNIYIKNKNLDITLIHVKQHICILKQKKTLTIKINEFDSSFELKKNKFWQMFKLTREEEKALKKINNKTKNLL